MQRAHRRNHFLLWLLLGLLIPLGLVMALLLRPSMPVESQRPGSDEHPAASTENAP